jgi:hypothetical protein
MAQPLVLLRFRAQRESSSTQALDDRLVAHDWQSIISPQPGAVLEFSCRKRVPEGTEADAAIGAALDVLRGLESATGTRLLTWSVRFTDGPNSKARFGEGSPGAHEPLKGAAIELPGEAFIAESKSSG